VPITLQVLVVSVIGAAYGPRLAAATVAAYLALGLQGMPVFAGTPEKGIGLAYMMGPTGGYLLGFWLQATVIGVLARAGWDRSVLWMSLAMIVGLFALYVPGVIWLSAGFGMGFGWENWYAYGVKTFIWVDALKLIVAIVAFPAIWRLVGNART
jgi:biotin transport system substrate-specific component